MKNTKQNYAIGVFDSGLGGLTVVKEIMRQLPNEKIVYFGDTARVPYGTKSKESIIRFSKENVNVLLKHNVKMIVVACNTCSSLALVILKQAFNLPIMGVIIPGAKKAARVTKNKKVGVIATPATINSQAYAKNIKFFDNSIKVVSQACPLFVPLAEEGWFDKSVTFDIAAEYLKNMKKEKVDALILGCTHYPLLTSVLQKVMGKGVRLVNSAQEIAVEVEGILKQKNLIRRGRTKPQHEFLVSDEPKHFKKLAKRFLGRPLGSVKRVNNV
ncbi:MAG: glutamate racemase [Omnitrophica WOR_2 bacterium GWA2_47_8]|nr:MAG: glutamate racemase [Omnitrophica WOR_2 bacterium GWA2_47_8]